MGEGFYFVLLAPPSPQFLLYTNIFLFFILLITMLVNNFIFIFNLIQMYYN